jgi:hypothetical protein
MARVASGNSEDKGMNEVTLGKCFERKRVVAYVMLSGKVLAKQCQASILVRAPSCPGDCSVTRKTVYQSLPSGYL